MYFEKVLETKKVPMAALKVSQKGQILVMIIKTLESAVCLGFDQKSKKNEN